MQEMNSEDIVLQELSVSFPYEQGLVLHPVDCTFPAREITAVIGESGSGKSVLGKAIVGLLSRAAVTGRILYDGQNLAQLGEAELRAYRGRRIFFMPQDPALALNIARVHHALSHLLIRAEHVTLPQHRIHKRRLAVIDVCNDRNIAQLIVRYHIVNVPPQKFPFQKIACLSYYRNPALSTLL